MAYRQTKIRNIAHCFHNGCINAQGIAEGMSSEYLCSVSLHVCSEVAVVAFARGQKYEHSMDRVGGVSDNLGGRMVKMVFLFHVSSFVMCISLTPHCCHGL